MAARDRKERLGAIIDHLNAIHIGDLAAIETRLAKAGEDLASLGETDLSRTLDEARSSLGRADLANFRRLVAQTVSRIGHLK